MFLMFLIILTISTIYIVIGELYDHSKSNDPNWIIVARVGVWGFLLAATWISYIV